MLTSRCPVCRSDVVIEEGSYESDLVTCAICGTDLEIASLHPPRLEALPDSEEEEKLAADDEEDELAPDRDSNEEE